MATEKISLTDYWNRLNGHDWYYDFSDDHRVWKEGHAVQKELEGIARQSPDHKALYEGFGSHHFSGPSWGTPKTPKPPRPA